MLMGICEVFLNWIYLKKQTDIPCWCIKQLNRTNAEFDHVHFAIAIRTFPLCPHWLWLV